MIMTADGALRARRPEGGTPRLERWGADSEYGRLRDVLLGPPETFHWMAENARYSALVRAALREGAASDAQSAPPPRPGPGRSY